MEKERITRLPESRDIVKGVARLTFPEEIALAKRIERGKKQLKRRSPDPAIIQDYEAAREQLILANIGLVVSQVKLHRGFIPFDIAFQEGLIGLMKGTQFYDWRKGFRFSTYATWRIRQGIDKARRREDGVIATSYNAKDKAKLIARTEEQLYQELKRKPTVMELSDATKLPIETIDLIISTAVTVLSLSQPSWTQNDDSNNNTEIGDRIADETFPDPESATEDNNLVEIMHEMLLQVPPEVARVLRLRYSSQPLTQQAIAKRLGLTHQRINQLEKEGKNFLATKKTIIQLAQDYEITTPSTRKAKIGR